MSLKELDFSPYENGRNDAIDRAAEGAAIFLPGEEDIIYPPYTGTPQEVAVLRSQFRSLPDIFRSRKLEIWKSRSERGEQ